MLWWLVASTSLVLIAAGVWLIARDVDVTALKAVTWRPRLPRVPKVSGILPLGRRRRAKAPAPDASPVAAETLAGRLAAATAEPQALFVDKAGPVGAIPANASHPSESAAEPAAAHVTAAEQIDNRPKANGALRPAPPPPPAVTLPAAQPRGSGVRSALDDLTAIVGDLPAEPAAHIDSYNRNPALESRWRQISPLVQVGVLGVNERTAAVRFEIAPEGDAGWSAGNTGFGHFRRLKAGGVSIAWLRIEVTHANRLAMQVRAHAREHAMLNAQVDTGGWPVSEDQIQRGLVDVVRGVVLFATARNAQPEGSSTTAEPPQRVSEPVALRVPQQGRMIPPRAPGNVPVHGVVDEAISLVNGAFGDVDARLVPYPLDASRKDAFERAFQIQFRKRAAGLLLVDDRPDQIGLSVGVSDPSRLAAAQRSELKREGTGPYELAEAIATCVWPTLALEGADKVVH